MMIKRNSLCSPPVICLFSIIKVSVLKIVTSLAFKSEIHQTKFLLQTVRKSRVEIVHMSKMFIQEEMWLIDKQNIFLFFIFEKTLGIPLLCFLI